MAGASEALGSPRAVRRAGSLVSIGLLVAFVALCAMLLALAPVEYPTSILHYVLIAYLAFRLIWIALNLSAAPTLLMLHWFTLFGAVIPLLYQYQGNTHHYPFISSEQFEILPPLIIISLFAVAVDVGHLLGSLLFGERRRHLSAAGGGDARTEPGQREAGLESLLALVAVAQVLIAGAVAYYGMGYFLASRLEQYLDFEASGLAFFSFNYLMRLTLYWCFVIALLRLGDALAGGGAKAEERRILIALVLFLAVEIALFSNPLGVARFLILGFAMMLVYAITDLGQRWLRLGFLVASVTALYVVFPVLGSAPRANEVVWVLDGKQLTQYLSHLDFDNGPQLLMGYRYGIEEGLHYGWNTLSALLVLVPRALWPDKSEGLGSIIITYFGGTFTNVSAPAYLEFYLDFGYAGVVALSLLLGLALGWLNRAAAHHGRYSSAWMMNIAVFAAMPMIVRGALMTAASLIYAHAIVIGCLMLLRYVLEARQVASVRTGSR